MNEHDPIELHFRVNDFQKKALRKLGVATVKDLVWHFPSRYGDVSELKSIASLSAGEDAVVFGKIKNLKTSKGFKTKIPMASGTIEDDTGGIKAIWFNQPYIAKMIAEDAMVRVQGKVSKRRPPAHGARAGKTDELYFSNPKIEKVEKIPTGVGDSLFGEAGEDHHLYPVYPESRGITSNWFYHAIQKIIKMGILDVLTDPLPEKILSSYNLPVLKTALIWIHAPKKESDAAAARKRFAFEEIFFIQLEKQKSRLTYQEKPAYTIEKNDTEMSEFTKRFPFSPTEAQKKAVGHILADFKRGHAMSRLLEGDVGSGKTAVAAASVYAVTTTRPLNPSAKTPQDRQSFGNLQTAYMCPTEILATQHFESFIKYFSHLPISVGLITGSGCRKFPSKVNPHGWTDISRNQFLKWVANGEIAIVVGTHALIQKSVKFKHLAYVIIDEQHRFGTAQRQKLATKEGKTPHLLSMTATPIPRTLALTIYGDLDLSLLDEMPAGRKSIMTEIVPPNGRESVYERIRAELRNGRQVYVICPRIDEPDPAKELALNAKSVTEEAKRLKKDVFPEYEIDILHSKMTPDKKDRVMTEFKEGHTKILVATSVVEVGVNVPNATVIVIEGAERFGLAQLHQLRGRVIRGNHQAYCYVFAETKTQKTLDRLKALKTAKNGFELAEYDLQFRGPGELSGSKQWGISDIGMEALKNIKMVEAARIEAQKLLDSDRSLSAYPLLSEELESRARQQIHFE